MRSHEEEKEREGMTSENARRLWDVGVLEREGKYVVVSPKSVKGQYYDIWWVFEWVISENQLDMMGVSLDQMKI